MGAYIGPARWTKTRCFDPFPFPVLTDAQSANLDQLGERLDAFRTTCTMSSNAIANSMPRPMSLR